MAAKTDCRHGEQHFPARSRCDTHDDQVRNNLGQDIDVNTDAEHNINGLIGEELDVADSDNDLRLHVGNDWTNHCLRTVVSG